MPNSGQGQAASATLQLLCACRTCVHNLHEHRHPPTRSRAYSPRESRCYGPGRGRPADVYRSTCARDLPVGRDRRHLSCSPFVVPVLWWTFVHLLGWEGREPLGTGPGYFGHFYGPRRRFLVGFSMKSRRLHKMSMMSAEKSTTYAKME